MWFKKKVIKINLIIEPEEVNNDFIEINSDTIVKEFIVNKNKSNKYNIFLKIRSFIKL
jgi:hypothetical protein